MRPGLPQDLAPKLAGSHVYVQLKLILNCSAGLFDRLFLLIALLQSSSSLVNVLKFFILSFDLVLSLSNFSYPVATLFHEAHQSGSL